ncbi:MAG: hypothetical protein ISS82_03235 [Nanoarchaeota archaeon]|nr:hypothetical protein [Nanoarchaeota archaeon]
MGDPYLIQLIKEKNREPTFSKQKVIDEALNVMKNRINEQEYDFKGCIFYNASRVTYQLITTKIWQGFQPIYHEHFRHMGDCDPNLLEINVERGLISKLKPKDPKNKFNLFFILDYINTSLEENLEKELKENFHLINLKGN